MLPEWKACVFFWIILRGIASGYSSAAIRFENEKQNKTQISQLQRPWILPSSLKVELVTISWLQHFPIVKSGTDGRRVKGPRTRGCSYQSHVRLLAHLFPKARAQRAWQWVHMTAGYQKGRHRPGTGVEPFYHKNLIYYRYWYFLTHCHYYLLLCTMLHVLFHENVRFPCKKISKYLCSFVVLTLICLILLQNSAEANLCSFTKYIWSNSDPSDEEPMSL